MRAIFQNKESMIKFICLTLPVVDYLGTHLQALILHGPQVLEHLSHYCNTLEDSVHLEFLHQYTCHSPILILGALENEHLKLDNQTLGCLWCLSPGLQQKQGALPNRCNLYETNMRSAVSEPGEVGFIKLSSVMVRCSHHYLPLEKEEEG